MNFKYISFSSLTSPVLTQSSWNYTKKPDLVNRCCRLIIMIKNLLFNKLLAHFEFDTMRMTRQEEMGHVTIIFNYRWKNILISERVKYHKNIFTISFLPLRKTLSNTNI